MFYINGLIRFIVYSRLNDIVDKKRYSTIYLQQCTIELIWSQDVYILFTLSQVILFKYNGH